MEKGVTLPSGKEGGYSSSGLKEVRKACLVAVASQVWRKTGCEKDKVFADGSPGPGGGGRARETMRARHCKPKGCIARWCRTGLGRYGTHTGAELQCKGQAIWLCWTGTGLLQGKAARGGDGPDYMCVSGETKVSEEFSPSI